MKKNLVTAVLMTIVTTILLGIIYPLVVTGLAQVLFPDKANGQLIVAKRKDHWLAHHRTGICRPGILPLASVGGERYDAANSNGSQYGPTNQKLIDRVKGDVATLQAENPGTPVPVDLVTTSASGLDPDISPAAAAFQIRRVAAARKSAGSGDRRSGHRAYQGTDVGIAGRAAGECAGTESGAGCEVRHGQVGFHSITPGFPVALRLIR